MCRVTGMQVRLTVGGFYFAVIEITNELLYCRVSYNKRPYNEQFFSLDRNSYN